MLRWRTQGSSEFRSAYHKKTGMRDPHTFFRRRPKNVYQVRDYFRRRRKNVGSVIAVAEKPFWVDFATGAIFFGVFLVMFSTISFRVSSWLSFFKELSSNL